MDHLVLRDDGSVEYRWTFTGTSAETGKRSYSAWCVVTA